MPKMIVSGGEKGRIRRIDIDLMMPAIMVGLLVAVIGPKNLLRTLLILPFALCVLGLTFLIIAKMSLFRRGMWISFGSSLMTRGYAKLYKFSYILLGVGVLLLLSLFRHLT